VVGVLDLGIDLDAWPWIWLGLAVVFALVELTVLGGSFVLLPWAVSAFAASLLAFYDVAVEIQWIVFVFGGAALFAWFVRYGKKFVGDNELPPGVGADRVIGLTAIVTAPIEPDDTTRPGRVAIGSETWGAITADDTVVPIGAKVRITAVQGTRVVVEPIATTPPTPLASPPPPPAPGGSS
jgi:membrane protein implicated in regulation of membrane protease activity